MRPGTLKAGLLGLLIGAVVLALAACGGSDEDAAAPTETPATAPTEAAAPPATPDTAADPQEASTEPVEGEPVAGDETDEGDGDADAQDGGTASAGGYGSVQTAGPGEDDGAGDTTSGPVIALVGGKPVDGPVQVKTKKGDKVRFTVTSDEAGEVHVHGFDIEQDVAPEEDAKFNFEAGFEGIFEIELHGQDGEVEIGSVRVEPR